MFHFNPKISIEVCLYHNHTTPLYGDGSLYPDLIERSLMIVLCDSIHF